MFNKKAIKELKETTDLRFTEINNTIMQISEKQNSLEQIQNATGKKTPSKWDSDNISPHDKLMAAYALNLCTVSVSQIIDYNDLNILEQEYDAILNNLNLENMPDDDALLKILKQILDTITFFRIQEGDKKFIDQEYQQKMKNAIWSAVPNFGVIVAGGLNPWSIGIALASQVGIGYMNYRKQKAQNKLEYEKQEWQLQRSAMEQFNALQRELFDTAWRLAKKYKFDDTLRLTENQIKQFNDILMDTKVFRKYERLDAIKDKFKAYPPFWYYFGNAANAIAQEYSIENHQGEDDDIRFQRKKQIYDEYKEHAKSHFEEFLKLKDFPLLREDKIKASCCLEYIDLLDGNTQKDKINELLDLAIANSGTENDIKQICAMDYLRIGNYEKAMEYLRILVTEKYNATTNAQLLSQLYVSKAIEEKSDKYLPKYETLSEFVNKDVLLPYPERFPESVEEEKQINSEFMDIQRKILARKFGQILENLVNKYFIQLNRKIENPSPYSEYKDSYFIANNRKRDEDFKSIFAGGSKQKQKKDYLDSLKDYTIGVEYVEILNDYLLAIQKIEGINTELSEFVEESVKASKNEIQCLQDKIDNKSFEYDDYLKIDELFKTFISQSVIELYKAFISYITSFETFNEIISTESNLHDLCVSEKIAEPDIQVFENTASPIVEDSSPLDVGELLGVETKNAKDKKVHIQTQLAVCKDYEQIALNEKFIKSNKVDFFTKGTPEYSKYFAVNKKKLSDTLLQIYNSKQIIAVLDEKNVFSNIDLFFTPDKLFISYKNTYGGEVFYSEIEFSDDSLKYKNQNGKPCVYKNEYIVMEKLEELISNLATGENKSFVQQIADNEKSSVDMGKSIALSVASYSLGFVPGLIMTTYQVADKIRKNENATKKKRPKNDNGKYGFSEKEMRIIGYKTNYFLSWKTNEDARLEYETNPEAFKKHFGFEPKSGKCFAGNDVSQNEVHEKYANDENGAYDFTAKELTIIGFVTNDKLTDKTFEDARLLYEESPERFKERYGFEPESGKWFE